MMVAPLYECEAFEVRTCDKKENGRVRISDVFWKRKQEIMKRELAT